MTRSRRRTSSPERGVREQEFQHTTLESLFCNPSRTLTSPSVNSPYEIAVKACISLASLTVPFQRESVGSN